MANDPKSATLIPEICVHDARSAIAFYERAFGAKDLGTHATPDGSKIMHSALALNGGVVFVRDDFPDAQQGKELSAKALGGSPVTIHLTCEDVQMAWLDAVNAGASVVMPLEKQFWGDTYGILADPFGHSWSMSGGGTEKPDTESAEYKAGAEALYPSNEGAAKPASKGKAPVSSAKPTLVKSAPAKLAPAKKAPTTKA